MNKNIYYIPLIILLIVLITIIINIYLNDFNRMNIIEQNIKEDFLTKSISKYRQKIIALKDIKIFFGKKIFIYFKMKNNLLILLSLVLFGTITIYIFLKEIKSIDNKK